MHSPRVVVFRRWAFAHGRAALLALVITLVSIPSTELRAATFTVTTTNDSGSGSLRQTIASASSGDTIVFSVVGTITLEVSALSIDKNLTIVGPGATFLTIRSIGTLDFSNHPRIFIIAAGRTVFLFGLTLANGEEYCGNGGNIYNSGTLNLDGCAVLGGSGSLGAGIFNSGSLNITNCLIANNHTCYGGGTYAGGAIYNAGVVTIQGSTLSGNSAAQRGGAIYNEAGAAVTVRSCTIANNSAGVSGGGIYNAGTLTLRNTILATNIAPIGPDCDGAIDSLGFNLVQSTNACTITGLTSNNLVSVTPRLGALAYYGGPTRTHSLLLNSPALDAGISDGDGTDQRGVARVINQAAPDVADGSDIGAFELETGPVPLIITPQPQSLTVAAGSNAALTVGVSGLSPITYYWFRGTNLFATTAIGTLALKNAQPAVAGNYTVLASNYFGSAISEIAALAVETEFTKITSGPVAANGGSTYGASWTDVNGDGLLDLFALGWGQVSFLYNNNGNGTFTTVGNGPFATNAARGITAVWADYDNDGALDVFVADDAQGGVPSRLFRNQGSNFASFPYSLAQTHTMDSAAWADYDGDGWVDLYVSCFDYTAALLRNTRTGTLERVSGNVVADDTTGTGCAWGDYDNDGRPDLFLGGRNGRANYLYRNLGDGNFSRTILGDCVPTDSFMAGAWGDYDNDGFLDLFIANFGAENNCLYHNNGNGTLTPLNIPGVTSDGGNATACAWADYDNDGFLDLFVSRRTNRNDLLYRNNGDGTFIAQTNSVVALDGRPSQGVAWGDYDRDGFADLFVANFGVATNSLYRNNGNSNAWFGVRLKGVTSNRAGIGAKVRVRAFIDGGWRWQMREISSGQGRASQSALEANFGLGDATNIDALRIEWPSGIVQIFSNVAPRQFLTIQEQTTIHLAVNGSGSVSYSPVKSDYFIGEPITLTATPRNTNWTRFLRWSDGDTNAVRTIQVGTSNVFTAAFTNLVRLEELLFKQWDVTFGGGGFDICNVARPTSDGGYILGGQSISTTNGIGNKTTAAIGSNDYWIVRLDSQGNKMWDRTLGTAGNDYLNSLARMDDGGFILAGSSDRTNDHDRVTAGSAGDDFWAARLDANGDTVWERSFGGARNDGAASVITTRDGSFLMGGFSASDGGTGNKMATNFGGNDSWIVKVSAEGGKLWDQSYGGENADAARGLAQTLDDGYVVAGNYSSAVDGSQAWIVKTDSGGNVAWSSQFGGADRDYGFEVEPTPDGGYMVAAVSESPPGPSKSAANFGSFDWWLLKLDAAGNRVWDKTFGGTNDDDLVSIKPTSDGGFILAGYSTSDTNGNKTSPAFGSRDGWLIRVDAAGNPQWQLTLGGTDWDEATSAFETADGGYFVAGMSRSGISGNKESANIGDFDYWAVKFASRVAPVGTPTLLVNGQYSPSNQFMFGSSNVVIATLQTTFTNGSIYYTLDGNTPTTSSTLYVGAFQLIGSSTVRAIACNSNCTQTAEMDPVMVTINNSVPVVAFTAPAPISFANPGTTVSVLVSASDSDGSVQHVEFFAGTNQLGVVTNAPYQISWTNVPLGTHTVTVRAFDEVGAFGNASATVYVVNGTLLAGPAFNQNWTVQNSPYFVSANVTASNIVVQPGVTIYGAAQLEITGSFSAVGTSNNPIVFTAAPSLSGWGGLMIAAATNGVEMVHCIVERSTESGIRIYGCSPSLRDCTVRWNSGLRGAGIDTDTSLTLEDCSIVSNQITYLFATPLPPGGYLRGAGVHSGGGTLTLRHCRVQDNVLWKEFSGYTTAVGGGGIFSAVAAVLEDCQVSGNKSTAHYSGSGARVGRGGGIYCEGTLRAVRTTFLRNENCANWYGQGGGVFALGSATFDRCFIQDNRCNGGDSAGGGALMTASDLWMTNCLVTGNQCGSCIGNPGLYAGSFSALGGVVENCTIANNGGQGSIQFAGLIHNSIIYNNWPGPQFWFDSTNVTVLHSDVHGGHPGTGNIDADPLFLDAINYLLQTNSPCVDAGEPGASFVDRFFPPSRGGLRNDMGAWGGPRIGFNNFGGVMSILVNGQESASFTFTETNSAVISLRLPFASAHVFYTIDGNAPGTNSTEYTQPFAITNTAATLRTFLIRGVAFNSNYTLAVSSGPFPVTFIPRAIAVTQHGRGTVSASPAQVSYSVGQQVTLTAAPARYYTFVRWSDGITTSNRTITVGVSNNILTAIFTNTEPLETIVLKQWEQDFGGSGDDYIQSLQQTSDGGYILGGTSRSGISGNKTNAGFGGRDYWMVKVNANGNKQWEQSFGGATDDELYSLQQTSDGGYILGGGSDSTASGNKTSPNFGEYDYWLVKVDANGNKQWEHTFGGNARDILRSVQQTSDGGFILGGYSFTAATGNLDYWVVKVDATGNEEWEQAFGGNQNNLLYSLRQTSDGGYVLGGASASGVSRNKASPGFGGHDYWVVKLDADGNKQWEQSFGGLTDDFLFNLQPTSDGGYVLGGYSDSVVSGNKGSATFGNYDGWPVKVDANGNKQWERSLGGGGADFLRSIQQTSDGGFIFGGASASGVSGNKTSLSFGSNDCWVVKVDASGNKQGEQSFGGTGNDEINSLQPTSDGGYILGGYSASGVSGNKTSANYGGNDYWIIKAFLREAPIGTSVVLVNGLCGISNTFTFTETNTAQVKLETTFTNGIIRYTLDGSMPTDTSPLYTGAFALTNTATVSRAFTIRAIAWNSNFTASATCDVVTVTFVPRVLTLAHQGRGTITASPAQLSYALGQTVVLTIEAERWYQFVRWSDGNTNNPRAIIIGESNNFFTAIFTNTVALEELVFLQWQQTFGGTDVDRLTRAIAMPDGGFLLGGYSYSSTNGNKVSTNFGNADYWIVRIDGNGNRLWEKAFGGAGSDWLLGMNATSDGGWLLVGESSSDASGNKTNSLFGGAGADFWVVKLDADGNKQWERSYGGSGTEGASAVQQTSDGGYIIGGYSASQSSLIDGIGNKTAPNIGQHDIWVVKTDANGNKEWDYSFGGGLADGFGFMQQTKDEGYFIGGSFRDNAVASRFWEIKLDAGGGLQWERKFGGGNSNGAIDVVTSTAELPDGGYFLGGRAESGSGGDKSDPNFGSFDYWFVRLNPSGVPLWNRAFGGSGDDELGAAKLTADGGFLVAGFSGSNTNDIKRSPGFGGNDGWVVGLDSSGSKKWDFALGGSDDDTINAIEVTPDGYLLAGNSQSTNGNKSAPGYGGQDYWVVKLAAREAPVGTPVVLVNGQYSPSNTFSIPVTNTIRVTITSTTNGTLRYTTNGANVSIFSPVYQTNGFFIAKSAMVRATVFLSGGVVITNDPVTINVVPVYPIVATSAGGGSVSISPVAPGYLSNSVVTLTGNADPGWQFMYWTGDASGTNNPLNLVVNQPLTNVHAVFGTTINAITSPPEGGSIMRTPEATLFPFGTLVHVAAVAQPGWLFGLWEHGDYNDIIEVSITNLVPLLVADFAMFEDLPQNTFSLALRAIGSGTVNKSPVLPYYDFNDVVSVSATPDPGFRFIGWSGNASGSTNPVSVIMNGHKTVTATFVATNANQPPIASILAPTNGSIFLSGEAITLSAEVRDGDSAIAYAEIYRGTILLGNVTNTLFGSTNVLFDFAWTNAPVGTNAVTVHGVDVYGAAGVSSPIIVIVNQRPNVTLQQPANGAVFNLPTNILISATASDPDGHAVERIEFFANASKLGETTALPYDFVWTNVSVGTHSITARVTDSLGATGEDDATVTVLPQGYTGQGFHFSQLNYSTTESAGSVMIYVEREPGGPTEVNYATANGSASSARPDYLAQGGVLRFSNGVAVLSITVPIVDNSDLNGARTFSIRLTLPGEATHFTSTTVTIQDDDAQNGASYLGYLLPQTVNPPFSRLQIFLDPTHGGWRLPWEFSWRGSGGSITGLLGGQYEIEYKPLSGYEAPIEATNISIAVPDNTSVARSVSYLPSGQPIFGALTVIIEPPELTNATWSLAGEPGSYPSGVTTNTALGNYIVIGSPVAGWNVPSPASISVVANEERIITLRYTLAETWQGSGSAATPQVSYNYANIVNVLIGNDHLPFGWNGQIVSDLGSGSGVVVKEHVVLTAAHVVWDEARGQLAQNLRWFFQRHAGEFEPKPLTPRGVLLLTNYIIVRSNYVAAGGTNGISTPESRRHDIAVLYFDPPAGRGGYGGYLLSDTETNVWLTQDGRNKMLVGYSSSGPGVQPGKIHETLSLNYAFVGDGGGVYHTLDVRGFPGNSGGPLYVQHSNTIYYPAAVYLGSSSDRSYVRAIDTNVVRLINLASALAVSEEATNELDPGFIHIQPGPITNMTQFRKLYFIINPPEATNNGARWSVFDIAGNFFVASNQLAANLPANLRLGLTYRLDFAPAAGFVAPPSGSLTITGAYDLRLTANYLRPPQILTQPQSLRLFPGETAMFSASVTGSPPLVLQWSRDGATLAGETASVLQLPSVSLAHQGGYMLLASNAAAVATSAPATLTILTTLPWLEASHPLGINLFAPTGRIYQVQTSALPSGTWSNWLNVQPTSAPVNIVPPTVFSTTNPASQFYRVRVLP